MRAMILRRAILIESVSSGPILIGRAQSPQVLRLEGFLRRNAVPNQKMPLGASDATTALLEQYGATADDATAICPNGAVLVDQVGGRSGRGPQSLRRFISIWSLAIVDHIP